MTQTAQAARTAYQDDVVALLTRQHGDIRNLFDEVERTTGEERRTALRRLVRLLAVHETAEQEVVHPFARRLFEGADEVVRERLAEEEGAKETLAVLDGMDPEAPDFLPTLRALRADVIHHARAEERYEFREIRRYAEPEALAPLAQAVRAAEAMAPTRPHPNVQGAPANLLTGPVAALMDRTRDAVRKAMHKEG